MADVLIVEDDADNRETLADLLESEGYSVSCAVNGKDALDQLRGGSPPGVILLDMMMPIMDGYEFRRTQQRDPALASIPVVIISGDGSVIHKASELNVDTYFLKPLDVDRLLDTLHRYVH